MQPDSIRVMGDKSTARETMKNAGVPTVPGSDGLLQVLPYVRITASQITFFLYILIIIIVSVRDVSAVARIGSSVFSV